jgi:tetratricopeptide (TPR) repeat protein
VSAPDFELEFARAQQLHAQGRLDEAERHYRELAGPGAQRETVLRALVELYMQARRPAAVIATLGALTEEAPDSLYYHARLAALLDGLGRTDAAIEQYLRLLKRQPDLAAAHFNLALLYKKARRYSEALASYETAIRCGISQVEEVYCSMGVLYSEMRRGTEASAMYEHALAHDPNYVPALFNRAGLFEEAGQREQAIALYRRIRAINPEHWESLARLAHAARVTTADTDLVDSLTQAIAAAKEPPAREGLYFALGKALDDLGRYDEAFAAYRAGNELGTLRNRPYDRVAVEAAFAELIKVFDRERIADSSAVSAAAPIFICGMFRSGSTLVEQLLAGHPSITAGGELEFLPWLVAARLMPYPERARTATRAELEQLASEYLARVHELYPRAVHVTDKRPDNFLHLGLIRMLFPAARIIYTRREPLDNCLSVYFQQLAGNLSYATNLEHTAHYYRQHERLMAHWMHAFGPNIFTVNYEQLIRSPEPTLRSLLDFLGLPWDERCLDFEHAATLVKSASVWQVREKLHTASSGRWRNYEPHLRHIHAVFRNEPPSAGPRR